MYEYFYSEQRNEKLACLSWSPVTRYPRHEAIGGEHWPCDVEQHVERVCKIVLGDAHSTQVENKVALFLVAYVALAMPI